MSRYAAEAAGEGLNRWRVRRFQVAPGRHATWPQRAASGCRAASTALSKQQTAGPGTTPTAPRTSKMAGWMAGRSNSHVHNDSPENPKAAATHLEDGGVDAEDVGARLDHHAARHQDLKVLQDGQSSC